MRDLSELLKPYVPPRAPPIDVAALRTRLHMSQRTFTRATRRPSGAALVLLHVIRHHPGAVRHTLSCIRNRRYFLIGARSAHARRTGRRFHLRAWLGPL